MKKLLSLCLTIAIIATMAPVAFAATTFSDLNSSHWAYNAVVRLVEEGTIGGYPDGTFRPDATVSRGEFVKMIGKTSTVTSDVYTDVNADDWYYEYVMASGLKPVSSGVFAPNTPILRGDVAELLWSRNGSSVSERAPYMIEKQYENADAAAWVYNKGIMVGDDYIDLRLDESLTRAEAAVLIIRARENTNNITTDFISKIDDKVYETVYNAAGLNNIKPYEKDATFTNGEIANIALRFATDNHIVLFNNFSIPKIDFEHEYAECLAVYGKYCIGEDKISLEYLNKPATVSDAITAVMFGLIRISTKVLDYGDTNNYYSDVTPANETVNKLLTMANKYNVLLYADGTVKGSEPVTAKQLACIVMQADEICGLNRCNIYGVGKSLSSHQIRKNIATYPECADDYTVILEDVPNDVYAAPYIVYDDSNEMFGVPKYFTNNAKDFDAIYSTMIDQIATALNNDAYNVSIEFIPSMIANNGDGYTYRVKIYVKSIPSGAKFSDLLPITENVKDFALKRGMTIWADMETGAKLSGVYFTPEFAGFNQVIKTIMPVDE